MPLSRLVLLEMVKIQTTAERIFLYILSFMGFFITCFMLINNSVRHYISILCILYIQGLINKAWTVSHSFYLKHRCRYDKRQKKETSQRQTSQRQTSEERNVATTNVGRKKRRKDKRRKKKKPEKQTMENYDPWTTNVETLISNNDEGRNASTLVFVISS